MRPDPPPIHARQSTFPHVHRRRLKVRHPLLPQITERSRHHHSSIFCPTQTPQLSPQNIPHRQRPSIQIQSRPPNLRRSRGTVRERHISPASRKLPRRDNKSNLMNAARANLHHANLPATYWEDAIRDAAYKYNILPHSATHQAPYTLWHDQLAKPKQLLIFAQLGTVPIYTHKKKLESRSRPVRYIFASNPRSITVRDTHTNQYHTVRTQDFLPYTKAHDPAITTAAVLRTTSPSSPPPFFR